MSDFHTGDKSRFLPAMAMYALTALPDTGWGSWDGSSCGYRQRYSKPLGYRASKEKRMARKAQRKARKMSRQARRK